MSTGIAPPSAGDRPGPSAQPGRRWLPRVVTWAVVAAGIALLAALCPEIIAGTFSSWSSAGRVALLVVGWVLFSFLVRRFVRPRWLSLGLVSVVGVALLSLTVLPYFRTVEVNESLDVAAAALQPVSPAVPPPAAPSPVAPPPAVPQEPVKLTTGQFVGLDGHRGSGEAAIFQLPDGSHVVRLEDFDVSNGPGLELYLVPGADQDSPGDGVNLGALRGTKGSLTYPVPASTGVSDPLTVLIWCEPFTVAVAGATQAPA